jgi:hypothetical protein
LRVCCRPDGSESGSPIRTLPHTARGRDNIDCVGGYWINRDIHYSTADIGRTDKSPTRGSEWTIRLLGRVSQRSSLSAGSFRGSNWNSAMSHALSNEPIFRWSLFLCASGIDFVRSLTWFAAFSIRMNGPWE